MKSNSDSESAVNCIHLDGCWPFGGPCPSCKPAAQTIAPGPASLSDSDIEKMIRTAPCPFENGLMASAWEEARAYFLNRMAEMSPDWKAIAERAKAASDKVLQDAKIDHAQLQVRYQCHTFDDAQPVVAREQIEKALCCPSGCLRSDDCFVEGDARRWGRSKREREQADAIVALLAAQPPAAPVEPTSEYKRGYTDGVLARMDAEKIEKEKDRQRLSADTENEAQARIIELESAQQPAAPVETIDSVPSCGQENDYRRARDPQIAALRPDLVPYLSAETGGEK